MATLKKTVKIIMIRHGETHFNRQEAALRARLAAEDITEKQYYDMRQIISTSQCDDFLNTKLTDLGEAQCQAASQILTAKYPNIKKAVISPIRRVIQTLEGCMSAHPNWAKLDIEFNENLREVLWANCDLGVWHPGCDDSIKYHERYNWGFMDKYNQPQWWFLENCSLEKYNE
jgi:phosphohistidine phosphatase SixA